VCASHIPLFGSESLLALTYVFKLAWFTSFNPCSGVNSQLRRCCQATQAAAYIAEAVSLHMATALCQTLSKPFLSKGLEECRTHTHQHRSGMNILLVTWLVNATCSCLSQSLVGCWLHGWHSLFCYWQAYFGPNSLRSPSTNYALNYPMPTKPARLYMAQHCSPSQAGLVHWQSASSFILKTFVLYTLVHNCTYSVYWQHSTRCDMTFAVLVLLILTRFLS